jgi:hypothetical protein
MGIPYSWRMCQAWFHGKLNQLNAFSISRMLLIHFVLVLLYCSRVKIIPTCTFCYMPSFDNMHIMLRWAVTWISCSWLWERFSKTSSSNHIIRNRCIKSFSFSEWQISLNWKHPFSLFQYYCEPSYIHIIFLYHTQQVCIL